MTLNRRDLDQLTTQEKRALLGRLLREKTTKRSDEFPLSFGQQALWFLYQVAPQSAAYNVVLAAKVGPPVNVTALQSALRGVVQRHDMLRATFSVRQDGPIQRVRDTVDLPLEPIDTTRWGDEEMWAHLLEESRRPLVLAENSIRIVIFARRGGECVLLFVAHHIAFDAWSLGVVLKELEAGYRAALNGKPLELPPLRADYSEFVEWQTRCLSGPDGETMWNYWREQLSGELPTLELPTDRTRSANTTLRGASFNFVLDSRFAVGVRELAKQEGTTSFNVLLTTFGALLHRYSGQSEVLIGSPTAGRSRADFEGIVGYFVNPIVIRAQCEGDPTFADFLKRLGTVVRNGLRHADFPFPLVVQRLQPVRDPSRSPIFQVMFNYFRLEKIGLQEYAPSTPRTDASLVLEPISLPQQEGQFDFSLDVGHADESLVCTLKFNTDLFDRATIERMARHYEQLLAAVVGDPTQRLSELPLLTTSERAQIATWNATATPYPREAGLLGLLAEQVVRQPEAMAVRQGNRSLTYAALDTAATRLADFLTGLEVGPNVPVGVCLDRTPDLLVALLGVLKAGGAYVPLDPAYPAARLAFMIENSGVQVVLTQTAHAGLIPASVPHVVCLDRDRTRIETAPTMASFHLPDPNDLAYVIYTSGSTGQPKGVEVSHRALVNLLTAMAREPGFSATDTMLAVTTLAFDIAALELFLPLICGGTVLLATREEASDPQALLKLLGTTGTTVMQATPATWRMLIEAGWSSTPGLKVLCGGEALPRDLANALQARAAEVWNLYGPTETTIWSSAWKVELGDGPVPIGRPIANTQMYVCDRWGNAQPVGVVGELYIGGHGLARGYRDRPDLTAERFAPAPFSKEPGTRVYRTGDLARWRPDGTIECLGRLDHQVKIRGFRIELGEIEAALERHPGVRQAVVVARPYGPQDTRLVGYVVAEPEADLHFDELRRSLRVVLPEYMVPSHFMPLEALPLTPNGKVDRKALPAPEADRQTEEPFVAPRNDTERQLAAIWEEALKIRQPGVHDSFFQLGGNSLRAMEVVFRIQKSLGVQLPLGTFMKRPTIASMASMLAEGGTGPSHREDLPSVQESGLEIQAMLEPKPQERYAPFPLTDVQEAYWIGRGGGFEMGNVATHVYWEAEIDGLDIVRYERTWQRLIERHDMLRAIVRSDGKQQVLEHTPPFRIKVQDLTEQPADSAQDVLMAARQSMSHQVLPSDEWPLFEIRAFRIADDRYRLHFSFDMLMGDAWSFTVLQKEFDQLYADPACELAPLGLSFRDYVLAEERFRGTSTYQRSQRYWDTRLNTLPHRPELPLARSPESIERPRFNRRQEILDPVVWESLKRKARAHGLTENGFLLAVYADVLATWSRRSRFVINLTLFNRLPIHPQVHDLVGDFTSVTLLEVELSPGETFLDMAKKLLSQLWNDLDHRSFSGVQVLRRLARNQQDRASGAAPVVFTSTLGFDSPPTNPSSPIRQAKVIYAITQTPQVWLDQMVSVENGTLVLRWDAVDELFPVGMVDDMFWAYVACLKRLAREDAAWFEPRNERVNKLVPAGQLQQRQSVNATGQPVSRDLLHVLFEKQAAKSLAQTAVVNQDVRLSYTDLVQLSRGFGHQLRELGATPNSLVAIVMEKGWEQVVAALSILQSGAAYVPIDANLPRERLLQLLKNSQARLVLTQPVLDETLEWPPDVRRLCVTKVGLEQDAAEPLEPVQSAEDLAYVIYTSGSTGMPKGVMIDHRGAVNTILDLNERFRVRPDDRVLALSSLSFDLSVYDIFGLLAAGGTIVIPEAAANRNPARWAELSREEKVTIWNSVPALMEMFVEYLSGREETIPRSFRLVMLSGDWIPVSLPDRIKSRSDHVQIMSLGGATEASIWSILYAIEHVDPAWKSIPYGMPMVNQTFHVLNEALEPCPVWVPGQLYIGGVGVAKGYWCDEEKTKAKFITHPRTGERLYSAGDLGRYLPSGDIEFLGREDFQVKIRGFRIELGEIEFALRQHAKVRSVVVTAVGKATADRRLIAYVVLERDDEMSPARQDDTSADTAARHGIDEELRRFLGEKLPAHMIPSCIVVLERLPLTPNGKVAYRSLPEPEAAEYRQRVDRAVPRSRTEEALVKVWRDVLRVEDLGIHDNFFELGGDSVSAIQLVSQSRAAGYGFTPNQVFLYPTIAELVEANDAESSPETVPAEAMHRAAEDRRIARGDSMGNREEIEI